MSSSEKIPTQLLYDLTNHYKRERKNYNQIMMVPFPEYRTSMTATKQAQSSTSCRTSRMKCPSWSASLGLRLRR